MEAYLLGDCVACKHYVGTRAKRDEDDIGAPIFLCTAYPDGIPGEIVVGIFAHQFPYKQENDVVFEPVPSTEEG